MTDSADSGSIADRLSTIEDELAALRAALSPNASREVEGHSGDDRPAVDTDGGGHTDGELQPAFESLAGELQELCAATNGGHGAISTRSGTPITPLDPDPNAIELGDIAHALSNLTRFTGQGREFYSVARHTVHVSRELDARGASRSAQQWGLLHDASEAYLADVAAPVKRSLPGYRYAERRVQAAVREAFELDLTPAEYSLVDSVDRAVGAYELAIYFPDGDHDRPTLDYVPDGIGPGSGQQADRSDPNAQFLERARELDLATAGSTT